MRPKVHQGQRQNSTAAQIPAPVKGINASTSLARMDEEECVYAFNIMPEDFGMRVRRGYAEWANGWDGGFAKTVITFEGNTDADDKLWVASPEGIFDVTVEGTTAPVQSVTFPSSTGEAGVCSYVNFSNDGDERFVLLCDGQNGYYIWTQSTDLWEKIAEGVDPGEINGIDPDIFNFVMIWKQRIWFIQRESGNAWYLDVPGTLTGDVTQFNFSDQFRFGGALVSVHNWTLDGGNGIDDHLVAISGAGDVVIFAGTDPESADTFGLVGSWYVGEVPFGNRIATEFSGELYILSVQGLLPLSHLLKGSSGMENPDSYITAKISPYIRAVMDKVRTQFGWQVHIAPKQSTLLINAPRVSGRSELGFVLYFGNGAWGMHRDIPTAHFQSWQGEVYFTDNLTNKLWINRGNVDRVYIDSEEGVPQAIDWSLLTAYNTLGQPAQYKRLQYIRPMFVANANPAFNVSARFDYDVEESSTPPVFLGGSASLWDEVNALWDTGLWGGGIKASDNPRGASGIGRNVAVSIRGRTGEPTNLVAFDITWDQGGYM